MAFEIENAQVDDASEILEVQKLAFHSEAILHDNFNIPPLLQTLSSIQENFQTFQFFKVVIGNKIVGAIKIRLLETNQIWIGRLVVHPDFQSQGIGKGLMAFVEAKYRDVAGFELFTAEKSFRNINFYQQQGYKISGTINEPGHDDIVIVKLKKPGIGKN